MVGPLSLLRAKLRGIVPERIKRAIRGTPHDPFAAKDQETLLSPFFNYATSELFPGFHVSGSDTLLDLGCGNGDYSRWSAEAGAEVISIDIDPSAVAATRRSLETIEPTPSRPFRVLQSDSNPVPVPSNWATRVLCQEVLEHTDDPVAILSELHRVGKPGSLYLLTVPDAAAEHIMKKISPKRVWQKPYHIHIFQRDEFAGMVRDAGFEILSHDWGSFYWSIWWILHWACEIPGHLDKFGGDASKAHYHWNCFWVELMKQPKGRIVRESLENLLPKSQRIVARKPG